MTEPGVPIARHDHANMAIANFCEIRRWMARIPGSTIDEDDDTFLASIAIPIPAFSTALAKRAPVDPERWVAHAREFHRQHRTPAYTVQSLSSDRDRLTPALSGSTSTSSPVMTTTRSDATIDTRATALTIADVVGLDALAENFAVAGQSFGFDIAQVAALHHEAVMGERHRWFTGYLDGKAVTSGAIAMSSFGDRQVAGIWNISTVPERRGLGLGTATTLHAMNVGAAMGATITTLVASPMGLPVYARMGFRTVTELDTWAPSQTG